MRQQTFVRGVEAIRYPCQPRGDVLIEERWPRQILIIIGPPQNNLCLARQYCLENLIEKGLEPLGKLGEPIDIIRKQVEEPVHRRKFVKHQMHG